jgi:siroheme synthase
VIYMGLGRLAETAARLVSLGRLPSTPVALIERATTENERVIEGTLANIAQLAEIFEVEAPAIAIVGEVVRYRASASRNARADATASSALGACVTKWPILRRARAARLP